MSASPVTTRQPPALSKKPMASSLGVSAETRQAALDSASGHLRMEGMYAPPVAAALDARFVAGEIDATEMIEAIKAHYNV